MQGPVQDFQRVRRSLVNRIHRFQRQRELYNDGQSFNKVQILQSWKTNNSDESTRNDIPGAPKGAGDGAPKMPPLGAGEGAPKRPGAGAGEGDPNSPGACEGAVVLRRTHYIRRKLTVSRLLTGYPN